MKLESKTLQVLKTGNGWILAEDSNYRIFEEKVIGVATTTEELGSMIADMFKPERIEEAADRSEG